MHKTHLEAIKVPFYPSRINRTKFYYKIKYPQTQ